MNQLKAGFRTFDDGEYRLVNQLRFRYVVTALCDAPNDSPLPGDQLAKRRDQIAREGLSWAVYEGLRPDDRIILGMPGYERLLDAYCVSLERIAAVGIPVVCLNWMAICDWFRSDLEYRLPDGSTTLAYLDAPSHSAVALPGWGRSSNDAQRREALERCRQLGHAALWEFLQHFLERVVPVAEALGLKLAFHPDDPPFDIVVDGVRLPRILTGHRAYQRLIDSCDSSANGICLCTGSLAPNPKNDLPGMIRHFGSLGRIHFAHLRNISRLGPRSFYESRHNVGEVPMREVVRALQEIRFDGSFRPDHGHRLTGAAPGRPGYCWETRALGAYYVLGLWDGLQHD